MRTLVAQIVAFAIYCFATSASASDYERVGYWNTDTGLLEIKQEWYGAISASIQPGDGMTAILLNDVERTETGGIAFRWTDMGNSWGPACDKTFVVTNHCGYALIEADGENRFKGAWFDCKLDPDNVEPWRGVLIAGYHWTSEEGDPELMPDRPFLDLSHEAALDRMAAENLAGFDPATAQSFEFDMSCDGGADQVFVWTYVNEERGPTLAVAVNHALPPVGDTAPEFLTAVAQLDAGSTGTAGVCVANGVPAPIAVSLESLSDQQRKNRRLPASCTQRLVVSADGCRALDAYWSISFDVMIGWAD